MMHLIDTFGPPVVEFALGHSDFRWEREWRKKGDLPFTYADIAFGMCPAEEISEFMKITNNQIVFIDPDWDKDMLKANLGKHAPKLLRHF